MYQSGVCVLVGMVVLVVNVHQTFSHCHGKAVTWCPYIDWQILGPDHQISVDTMVTSLQQCQTACIGLSGCKSFDYSANETTCQYHRTTIQTKGVPSAMTIGVDNYAYYCGNVTCPNPEPEPESEQEPEPEGEAEITPEEFWRWLRDEPVWFALMGMGVFILLLVITIIVLLCRVRPKDPTDKSVYEQTHPTTLDRNFVYMRDNSKEDTGSKAKEAEIAEENRRSKLYIQVP